MATAPVIVGDEDRQWWEGVLRDPRFNLILERVHLSKPGVIALAKPEIKEGVKMFRARNEIRAHEIRGWELFESALLMAADPYKQTARAPLEETFPDAGRLDFENPGGEE